MTQSTQIEEYPFVEELLTDISGQVHKVVLPVKEYRRLLEAIEDESLYQMMQAVRNETPLSLEAALKELDADES